MGIRMPVVKPGRFQMLAKQAMGGVGCTDVEIKPKPKQVISSTPTSQPRRQCIQVARRPWRYAFAHRGT